MYENSGHSESVWEITTGSNANTGNLNDCGRCHDGRIYIQFTKGTQRIDEKTLTEAKSLILMKKH